MDLTLGLAAALVTFLLLRSLTPARQLNLAAIFLVVAALIYVALALRGGFEWFGFELVGLCAFTLLAAAGVRYSPWFLVAGWALHVPWDLFVHHGGPAHFVPTWYPGACLAYDFALAGWVAWLAWSRGAT